MSKPIVHVRGTAIWPHLNTPDTKFKDEGEFHTKLRITADQAQPLISAYTAMQEAEMVVVQKAKKGKRAKAADLPVQPEFDSETGEETGNYIVRAAMKASGTNRTTGKAWQRRLPIFDSQGKPAADFIKSGSEIVIAFTPAAWANPKAEVGVKLYLEGVQIINLAGGGSSASGLGFGAVDGGYVASSASASNEVVEDEDEGSDEGAAGADTGYDFA